MNSEMFDKAKINFEEGIKYFQQEKYDLAEISFLNSLKIIPDRLSTIGNLIKIYIKTYQTDKLNNTSILYMSGFPSSPSKTKKPTARFFRIVFFVLTYQIVLPSAFFMW